MAFICHEVLASLSEELSSFRPNYNLTFLYSKLKKMLARFDYQLVANFILLKVLQTVMQTLARESILYSVVVPFYDAGDMILVLGLGLSLGYGKN